MIPRFFKWPRYTRWPFLASITHQEVKNSEMIEIFILILRPFKIGVIKCTFSGITVYRRFNGKLSKPPYNSSPNDSIFLNSKNYIILNIMNIFAVLDLFRALNGSKHLNRWKYEKWKNIYQYLHSSLLVMYGYLGKFNNLVKTSIISRVIFRFILLIWDILYISQFSQKQPLRWRLPKVNRLDLRVFT